jgi:hypothetical protein
MTLPVFCCCRRSAMNANSPKASQIPIALRLFSPQLPAVLDRKSIATWIAQEARPDACAFDQHMHALNDKALIVPFHGDDALHPQYVGTETLHDKLDPWNESVPAHWLFAVSDTLAI